MKGLQSGDILSIPLPKGLGYAFAKYINLLETHPNCSYPDVLKVYDYRTLESCGNIEDLDNKQLLFGSLLVAGLPPAIKKGSWKIIGKTPVKEGEREIPHFKIFDPSWATDEKDAKQWYFVIEADINKKVKSSIENVKHLETIGAMGSDFISTKLAMAFLIKEGKNVVDYFDLNEYYEIHIYEKLKKWKPYYELPDHMKGRALDG